MQNLIFSVKIHPSTNSFTSHECVHSLHEITSNWIYFLSQPVHKRYLSTRMVCTESGFVSATEKVFSKISHEEEHKSSKPIDINFNPALFTIMQGFVVTYLDYLDLFCGPSQTAVTSWYMVGATNTSPTNFMCTCSDKNATIVSSLKSPCVV